MRDSQIMYRQKAKESPVCIVRRVARSLKGHPTVHGEEARRKRFVGIYTGMRPREVSGGSGPSELRMVTPCAKGHPLDIALALFLSFSRLA